MYIYLSLFSIYLGFLPLILFAIVRKRLNSEAYLILPYLILTFLSSGYELIFTYLLDVDSSVWFKIYPFCELLVLIHYFYHLLKGRYKYMYWFFGLLYSVCFAFIAYQGKIDNFMDGDAYLQTVESVFVILAIILWMKYAFINLQEDSLLKYPQFYFISGLLFYFSGTLFMFILGSFILENQKDNFLNTWMLNLFFNVFFKILLLIGIWKARIE